MASYLVLASYTDQGMRTVKQSPQRLDAVKEMARAAGGRIVFFYMTMGQYDLAALFELPGDEAMARVALSIGALGNVRTTTLKAFTEGEYRNLIAALP